MTAAEDARKLLAIAIELDPAADEEPVEAEPHCNCTEERYNRMVASRCIMMVLFIEIEWCEMRCNYDVCMQSRNTGNGLHHH